MGGVFVKGENKTRPGFYHRTENANPVASATATSGVVALIAKANWGPIGKMTAVTNDSNYEGAYGNNTGELIKLAFKGGAETVLVVRAGDDNTGTTTNTTLDELITINGKYKGNRNFDITIRDSITDDGKDCMLYEGDTVKEKYTFTTVQELADKINNKSKMFTAKFLKEGTLSNVVQAAFNTKGEDPTVTIDAYSNALKVFEPYAWNCICVDSSSNEIKQLVSNYQNRTYSAGKYPMCVFASGDGNLFEQEDGTTVDSDDLEKYIAEAKKYNDFKINYVLGGAIKNGKVYDGYRMAAYMAGVIAGTPTTRAITHKLLSDFDSPQYIFTNTQIEKAIKNGCIVLTTNSNNEVLVESGVNTYVKPDADHDAGWGKIKRTRIRFELMERIDLNTEDLIGVVNNDEDGRSTVLTRVQNVIDDMINEGKLTNGTCVIDPENAPAGDSAWFIISADDIDSLEKAYLTYRFRFSASETTE